MDIYLSTIIDSHNYGTVLQAAATSDLLSPYGDVKVIDYCRPHWTTRAWRTPRTVAQPTPSSSPSKRRCACASTAISAHLSSAVCGFAAQSRF